MRKYCESGTRGTGLESKNLKGWNRTVNFNTTWYFYVRHNK